VRGRESESVRKYDPHLEARDGYIVIERVGE
jgi:hypothetical protein